MNLADGLTQAVVLFVFGPESGILNTICAVGIADFASWYDDSRIVEEIPQHRVCDAFPLVQRRCRCRRRWVHKSVKAILQPELLERSLCSHSRSIQLEVLLQ